MTTTQSKPSAGLWAVVLAAGEGTRLTALTRALCGEALPKQFATIQGDRSMLQTTLRRTARFSPSERTVVVVSTEREGLARAQIGESSSVDVVAQPKNVGTGPGVLLPLSRVAARDPDALVVVVPSDHYVRDPEPFVESIRRAAHVARHENAIVLVAAVPSGPETQYGWILTHPDERQSVAGFVEKPNAAIANEQFRAGALWSTFIIVGSARHLLALARERLPEQSALFDAYWEALGAADERDTLSKLYESMAAADFSRDVLERSEGLRVVALEPCGWSDWGTPDRVLESLRGTVDFDVLLDRLQASRTVSDSPFVSLRSRARAGTAASLASPSKFPGLMGLLTAETFT
jgi:mannose-1-phosphate guanylyltransferase